VVEDEGGGTLRRRARNFARRLGLAFFFPRRTAGCAAAQSHVHHDGTAARGPEKKHIYYAASACYSSCLTSGDVTGASAMSSAADLTTLAEAAREAERYEWSTAVSPTYYSLTPSEQALWLARVGLPPDALQSGAPDAAQLARLVRAHTRAIAFENLDVALGVAVRLDPASLAAKLLAPDRRRGGYCLETNGLLAYVLRAAGFEVALRHARVWLRAEAYTPREPPNARQHVVLVVRCPAGAGAAGECAAGEWLVDAGFGGGGPAEPLPLRAGGAPVRVGGDLFRLERGDAAASEDSWLLWAVQGGVWKLCYSFDHFSMATPVVHAIDFILCSFFVQHAPNTLFKKLTFATVPTAHGRVTLLRRELRRKGEEQVGETPELFATPLADARAFRDAAKEHVGIDLNEEEARAIFEGGE